MITKLEEFASSDLIITTGANDYFFVKPKDAPAIGVNTSQALDMANHQLKEDYITEEEFETRRNP